MCFLDDDELMDARYSDFDSFTNQETIDSVIFNMVHLWDDEDHYNMDYPYTYNGITIRFKMFRNIGRTQIIFPKGKLHCNHTSYTGNVYHSPLLVIHYGHLSKEMRINKYNFYMKEDTEQCQKDYSHLINDHIRKGKILDISIENLKNTISIYKK